MGFYASICMIIVRYFAEIDYLTVVIKNLFFEEQNDRKFFDKYLHEDENDATKSKANCCKQFFSECLNKRPVIDEKKFEKFNEIRYAEKEKARISLEDGEVDKSDITTIIFDMFSKRKKFEYHLNERILLYMGFLGPVLKFFRCRCFNYDNMIRVNKMFKKAKAYLDSECDIIDIMDSVRKSNNFNQTFLTRQ